MEVTTIGLDIYLGQTRHPVATPRLRLSSDHLSQCYRFIKFIRPLRLHC